VLGQVPILHSHKKQGARVRFFPYT
jgi:hypothetical protein